MRRSCQITLAVNQCGGLDARGVPHLAFGHPLQKGEAASEGAGARVRLLMLRYFASSAPTGQSQVSPGQRPG